ncbi:MAG: LLM class oxidoreductase [Deltaproteobacteria bacterium]|nr:LLM class oxidoreductase [Deltaproteobacteria bacterium]
MFAPGHITLGVMFPIESFEGDAPTMRDQEQLACRAEELGFAALWVRDVPLRDPQVSDLGQVFDPWVYLGWIAAHTSTIALATTSLILPLRHPLHTAKAAASLDQLSKGRLVLGTSIGERTNEFPAFGIDPDEREALFRENFGVIRAVMCREYPMLRSSYGALDGSADCIPKPIGTLPMLVSGSCQQTLAWIAHEADGWISYPRPLSIQAKVAASWRAAVAELDPSVFKPFAQSFHVDLATDPDAPATPLHFGLRGGRNVICHFLEELRDAGVHHVILNFRYAQRDARSLVEEFGAHILPRLSDASPMLHVAAHGR